MCDHWLQYMDTANHKEALAAWRNAALQKPTYVPAWTSMITLLDNLGMLAGTTAFL